MLDNILNSLMIGFLFLTLIIAISGMTYNKSLITLLSITSILFSGALTLTHSFYRQSAFKKFYMNLMEEHSINSNLDFAINTIIDQLCSKGRLDSIRVKSFILVLLNEWAK